MDGVCELKIFGLILLVLQTVITCSYFNKVFFFKLKYVKKKNSDHFCLLLYVVTSRIEVRSWEFKVF